MTASASGIALPNATGSEELNLLGQQRAEGGQLLVKIVVPARIQVQREQGVLSWRGPPVNLLPASVGPR